MYFIPLKIFLNFYKKIDKSTNYIIFLFNNVSFIE